MSRAFVKEVDDAPAVVQDRTISGAPNRVTPRGAVLIAREIARIEQALAVADAEDAKLLRRDHRYWLARSGTAQIVATDPRPTTAGFGVSVTILRGDARRIVTIVGEDKADPAEGLLAWTSPLARALEGAGPGEVVEVHAAGRVEPITVLAINGPDLA